MLDGGKYIMLPEKSSRKSSQYNGFRNRSDNAQIQSAVAVIRHRAELEPSSFVFMYHKCREQKPVDMDGRLFFIQINIAGNPFGGHQLPQGDGKISELSEPEFI